MKNLKYISALLLFCLLFTSCDHEENLALPDFLDGTEYGILLHVDVTGDVAIDIANLASANVAFDVSFDGDQRPVESITVNKIFVASDGTVSAETAQSVLTQFPASLTLSVDDLVNGIAGLTKDDLQAGDRFQIKFKIKYQDGKEVSRFGTLLNPNFDVTFQ